MRSSWLVPLLLFVPTAGAQSELVQRPPELVARPTRVVATAASSRQSFDIASAILKETRTVHVALPPSFAFSAPERRYPVTVVTDGEGCFAPAVTVSDELARHGLIPESIVVAIENIDGFRGRVRDLTPPGLSVSGSSLEEGGDRFLDFIEKELLPAVERQFRGGAPRTFVGHSSGGILATWVAATRPGFRAVVAIDAPTHLDQDWLAKKLIARAGTEPPPLRYVSLEVTFGWSDARWSALVAAAPASWKLHREKLRLEGHETLFFAGAYIGLREVFADWSRLAAPKFPTTSILPSYAAVGTSFGAPMIPPKRILRDVVDDLLMEGRGALAREAYALLASGYGAPSDSAALLGEIAEVEKRPPPTETVEGLLATPFPTPEEARAFLGEWTGSQWMNADQPRRDNMTLRIRVEDGRVIAEMRNSIAPPEGAGWKRVDYLRITPGGLTYGNMNGMRPRGVVLWEGKLEGDVLSGTSRWGGISFKYPEGMDPPQPGFSFKRVKQ